MPPAVRLRAAVLIGLLALAGLGAGCQATAVSPSSPSPSVASNTSSGSPAPAPTATPTQPPFPLTLTDDEGTPVVIHSAPERIVSLSPANTEILWALGAGARQVGGTDADDYPAQVAALPHVASFTGVDVERVVQARADLVLATGNGFNPAEAIVRLRALGIQVLVVYAPDVGGVLRDIELIGTAIGERPAALALIATMRAEIGRVSAAARAQGTRPRTFYEIDASNQIYGPADGSFLVEMIDLAGGDPITTGDSRVFAIGLERLVAADPEVIVLGDAAYGTTAAVVAARPGWGTMTAVRTGAIRPVNDTIVTRPGPRLAEGLVELARAIHPGVAF